MPQAIAPRPSMPIPASASRSATMPGQALAMAPGGGRETVVYLDIARPRDQRSERRRAGLRGGVEDQQPGLFGNAFGAHVAAFLPGFFPRRWCRGHSHGRDVRHRRGGVGLQAGQPVVEFGGVSEPWHRRQRREDGPPVELLRQPRIGQHQQALVGDIPDQPPYPLAQPDDRLRHLLVAERIAPPPPAGHHGAPRPPGRRAGRREFGR